MVVAAIQADHRTDLAVAAIQADHRTDLAAAGIMVAAGIMMAVKNRHTDLVWLRNILPSCLGLRRLAVYTCDPLDLRL